MNKKVVIIGYSGHAFVGADILLSAGFSLAGYCDIEFKSYYPFNLDYLGNENHFFQLNLMLHPMMYLFV